MPQPSSTNPCFAKIHPLSEMDYKNTIWQGSKVRVMHIYQDSPAQGKFSHYDSELREFVGDVDYEIDFSET